VRLRRKFTFKDLLILVDIQVSSLLDWHFQINMKINLKLSCFYCYRIALQWTLHQTDRILWEVCIKLRQLKTYLISVRILFIKKILFQELHNLENHRAQRVTLPDPPINMTNQNLPIKRILIPHQKVDFLVLCLNEQCSRNVKLRQSLKYRKDTFLLFVLNISLT